MSAAKKHYCTYFDRNYLVKGIAMIESLRRHERDCEIFVVCMDELTRAVLDALALPAVTTIGLHEIEQGDDALVGPRRERSLVEYYWTLTPTILLRVLERCPDVSLLTYLDADLFFFASPAPIFDELGTGSILIHEHRFSPDLAYLAENGRFNVGLMCFRRDAHALGALRWWRERCNEWCFKRIEAGKMGDQLYLEDWPERFAGVVVLKHVGAGLAPWNHLQYDLSTAADGQVLCDGLPAIFYHFHSLTMVNPDLVMPAGTAYGLTEPVLRLLVVPYLEHLHAAIRQVLAVVPEFRFGIVSEGTFNPVQTFVATPNMASLIAQSGAPQVRRALTERWDLYASHQLRPAPTRAPAARPAAAAPIDPESRARDVLERAGALGPLLDAARKAAEVLRRALDAAGTEVLDAAREALVALLRAEIGGSSEADAETPAAPDVPVDAALVRALSDKTRQAIERGRLDAAKAAVDELLALVPESLDVHITAATVAIGRGDLETAERLLVRATVIDDGSAADDLATTFAVLAERRRLAGAADLARLDLERALRVCPGHERASAALATLAAETAPRTARGLPPTAPLLVPAPPPDAAASQPPCTAARRAAEIGRSAPAVSLVVLTFNGLEDTIRCLQSVEANTTVPYELVVVDNASTDGTIDWLRDFAAERPHVRVIQNGVNTGFAGGNNLGTAIARARHVVWLNNDTIVTERWIEGMLAVIERHPRTALVGPRSNYVAGPQMVDEVPYRAPGEVQGFARRWADEHRAEDEQVSSLVAFCLLVSRALIDQVGGLDTRFGRGNFEDNDFCLRAAATGAELRIAHEVFVHHEGSKTFKRESIDYLRALEDNWAIFKEKWAIAPERTLREGLPPRITAPTGALAPVALPAVAASHRVELEGRWWRQADRDVASATDRDVASTAERNARFDAAERAAAEGRWQQAAEQFATIAEAFPKFAPAHVGLASAAFARGDVQLGAAALDRACALAPDNLTLHMQRAIALAHAGLVQRAQDAFVTVLKMDPDNLDALLSLAELCRSSRHFVEAVELLDRANAAHPNHPEVVAAVGALAAEIGDTQAAKRALHSLTAIAPEHPQLGSLRQAVAQA